MRTIRTFEDKARELASDVLDYGYDVSFDDDNFESYGILNVIVEHDLGFTAHSWKEAYFWLLGVYDGLYYFNH